MSGGDELNDIFGSDDENGENLLGPKIKDKQKSKTVSTSSFYINEIPKLNPSGYSLTLRLPNFLKIATSAYDSTNLEREEVETKIYQEATSVIRWRFSENNELESNARLVKFKNGEYQLIVGGEVFEGKIVQAPLRFAFMKQTNNPPAKLTSEFSDQIEMVNENTPDSCLECIGEVSRKININPSSVDSEAHARIAMNSTMKHRKASRMKSLDKDHMAVNPEKEKEARKIAHSDEMKRERRLKESSGGSGEAPRRYLSASFLEEGLEQQEYDEEDDGGHYDSYNIKNLKRKSTSSSSYKRSSNIKSNSSSKPVKKSRPSFITNTEDVEEEEDEDEEDLDEYEDDEEEEEEEEAEEVVTKKKKKQEEEDEEEEEEEEDVRITEEIITPKRPKVSAEPPPRTSSQNNTTIASASQETSSSTISATESAAAAVTASDSTKTNPTATVITTTTAAKKRTSRVIVDSDED